MLLDRYLVVVSAAVVAAVWVIGDIVGYVLSEGSKAAMGSFILYAALKTKTDSRWRELEEGESPAKVALAPPAKTGDGGA